MVKQNGEPVVTYAIVRDGFGCARLLSAPLGCERGGSWEGEGRCEEEWRRVEGRGREGKGEELSAGLSAGSLPCCLAWPDSWCRETSECGRAVSSLRASIVFRVLCPLFKFRV